MVDTTRNPNDPRKQRDPNDPSTWPSLPPSGVTVPSAPSNRRVPVPPAGGTLTVPPGSGVTPGTIVTPPASGAPSAAAPTSQYPAAPGTSTYDLYAINDQLRNGGMDGWQIVGTVATPVQTTTVRLDPDTGDYVPVPSGVYIINVRNPTTGEVRSLSLMKTGDPKGEYGWQIAKWEDLEKPDPSRLGHSGNMVIGTQLWGTNNSTGVFEPVPNAPPITKDVQKWSGLTEITNADGSKDWWGIDPSDGSPKKVDAMPHTPAVSGYSGLQQIDDGQGHLVWYGQNGQTRNWEPVPTLPTINKPPETTTAGGVIYQRNPDGTYAVALNTNPAAGTKVFKVGDDGYMYRFTADGRGGTEPDPTFTAEPFTQAAKDKKAGQYAVGQRVQQLGSDGKVYTYKWDGQQLVIDKDAPATQLPGTGTTSTIATSADQEFITQRNPDQTISSVRNPSWAPKDAAGQLRQAQAMATDKYQELQKKIGTNGYTAEQATADFDQYWASTIEPMRTQVKQTTQQEDFERQLKIGAENRARETQQATLYTTAANLGQQAVTNQQAMEKNMVGPSWSTGVVQNLVNAFRTGKPAEPFPADAFTYQRPDYNQLAQQMTAHYLKQISPTAAAIAGGGAPALLSSNVQSLNPDTALARSSYQPFNPLGSAIPQAVQPTTQPVVINVSTATPPNVLPGSNYGAAQGYPGGAFPWTGAVPQPLGNMLGNFSLPPVA